MDQEKINRERHYGKVLMLVNMIKANESKMQKTGFGYGFSFNEIKEWTGFSEIEIEEIQDICYLVSARGVRETVIGEVAKGKISSKIFEDKTQREIIERKKLGEHIQFIREYYDYPEEILEFVIGKGSGKEEACDE